jgi:hypothetical protein
MNGRRDSIPAPRHFWGSLSVLVAKTGVIGARAAARASEDVSGDQPGQSLEPLLPDYGGLLVACARRPMRSPEPSCLLNVVVNVRQRLGLEPCRPGCIGQLTIDLCSADKPLGYFLMRHSQISTSSGCPNTCRSIRYTIPPGRISASRASQLVHSDCRKPIGILSQVSNQTPGPRLSPPERSSTCRKQSKS